MSRARVLSALCIAAVAGEGVAVTLRRACDMGGGGEPLGTTACGGDAELALTLSVFVSGVATDAFDRERSPTDFTREGEVVADFSVVETAAETPL